MAESLFSRACARAHEGMEIAAVAAADPQRVALYHGESAWSFAELNARANQVVRALRRAGVERGDAIALVCGNRPEFAAVAFAAHRAGLRLTPVNWHLSAADVAWVVRDCGARALILDADVAAQSAPAVALPGLQVRVSIGADIAGCERWDVWLAGIDGADIADPARGSVMMYTSGTTGRPKGVLRPPSDPAAAAQMQQLLTAVFRFEPDGGADLALATGPLYHAGPYGLCLTTPLTAGIGTVLMPRWEPLAMLELIERFRVTHTFCVPTMFNRLLALDPDPRLRHDLSSLRFLIHGAAPCSVDTKRRMLDWLGPIIWEMFAGTEGPGTFVGPEEWLARPGTVGRAAPGQVLILDDEGRELPRGVAGRVFLALQGGGGFEYHGDPGKTAATRVGAHFTAGDIGYLDDEGYLFLTGRSADVIISGGVNLYPQEIDDVLACHPQVADVACVGVPDADLGEVVCAIVEPRPGHPPEAVLRESLMQFCAERLARQKSPRRIDFVTALPRSAAGKILRAQLRAPYWQGRDRQI